MTFEVPSKGLNPSSRALGSHHEKEGLFGPGTKKTKKDQKRLKKAKIGGGPPSPPPPP